MKHLSHHFCPYCTLHRLSQIYQERQQRNIKQCDEYGNVWAEGIDMEKLTMLIKADLTIPQISEQFPEYTYEQVYGSILRDRKLNPLYRKHGQKKIKKHK